MVSRRTYFIISMMMAVLFFLFVFSGAAKEDLNEFDTNQHAKDFTLTKDNVWNASKDKPADIVLIGDKNSAVYSTVSQWCLYSKNKLKVSKSIKSYKLPKKDIPKLILIDSDVIDYDKQTDAIQKFAGAGVNIVFCNLPEFSVVKNNAALKKLLGIDVVDVESVRIEGVRVYQGFLLGDEKIYKAKPGDKEELKNQDFDLNIPWYQTKSGTKTYMSGMLDPDTVENEYMPAVIWRNSIGDSMIYAINGDFMSSDTGIGILSSILYECQPYYLYPVVNAQNLVFTNFPGIAKENQDIMMDIYSRSLVAVARDIVWPGIIATTQKNLNRMTCFFSLQYNYRDSEEPSISELNYFMRVLNEENAEAGLSTSRLNSDLGVDEKLKSDSSFLDDNDSGYKFSAYYAKKDDIDSTAQLAGTSYAKNMKTITTEFEDNQALFAFLSDDLTLQRATIDGFHHSYREDFRVKSLETALCYSNILTDISRITWPKSGRDRWEILSEYFSKYTNTYWNDYKCYKQTTISESDDRVRRLLAVDYNTVREGSTIRVDVKNAGSRAWFILRTHAEEIKDMTGGTYNKIYDDAYLIEVHEPYLEIELQDSEAPVYLNR